MHVTTALSTFHPGSSVEPAPAAGLPTRVVGDVIRVLRDQLGGKWSDMYPVADVNPERAAAKAKALAAEWGRGLAGFQQHEIRRGLDRVSDYASRGFAPTLPEFKQFCRPCLDAEFAWHEAQEGLMAREQGEHGAWTHPAVFFAASSMAREVRSGDWARHRTRWTRTLARELEQGFGRQIPKPAMQLEHTPAPAVPPPAAVLHQLAMLRRLKEPTEKAAAPADVDRAAEDERLLREAREYAAAAAAKGKGA